MQEEQDYSAHAFFRGIILLGFFLLLFRLIVSENIQLYIAPKMMPFTYFSLVILLLLGIIQLWRGGSTSEEEYCNCGFDHLKTGSPLQTTILYFIFVFPVITGLWFPANVLDSSIAINRGVNYAGGNTSFVNDTNDDGNNEFDAMLVELEELKNELFNSKKIVIDDERYMDIMYFMNENLDAFVGKEIEISGFVLKNHPDFEENQFLVARFGVTCCVADATLYGIMSEADKMHPIYEDEWVRVTGLLSKTMFDSHELPFLHVTEIVRIDQPESPYVY